MNPGRSRISECFALEKPTCSQGVKKAYSDIQFIAIWHAEQCSYTPLHTTMSQQQQCQYTEYSECQLRVKVV